MNEYEEKALAALKFVDGGDPLAPEQGHLIALAQVYATLYLGEQQQIQNIMILSQAGYSHPAELTEQAARMLGFR